MAEETLTRIDAIKARKSCRTYAGKLDAAKQELVARIVNECNQLPAPFGTDASIGLHEPGLGAFGFISQEAGWIILKIPKDKEKAPEYKKYIFDASFKAHNAVLRLVQNRIATVWVGGTFNEKKAEASNPGFKIPCVVAYGLPAESKPFISKALSWIGVGNERIAFEKMYYDAKNKDYIKAENVDSKIAEFLGCIRLYPSANNEQPARLIVNEDRIFSVYEGFSGMCTAFDMGIFVATAYFYTNGNIQIDVSEQITTFPSGGKYICKLTVPDNAL